MKLYANVFESPLGQILLVTSGATLVALDFADCETRMHRLLARRYTGASLYGSGAPVETRSRLTNYFDGDLRALSTIPFDTGGTIFQRRVWAALTETQPGQTCTYEDIAVRIASPTACRAVGLANGSNPVAIIVPCHRVLGKSGNLTGYAGGLDRKKWLLDHESRFHLEATKPQTSSLTLLA